MREYDYVITIPFDGTWALPSLFFRLSQTVKPADPVFLSPARDAADVEWALSCLVMAYSCDFMGWSLGI